MIKESDSMEYLHYWHFANHWYMRKSNESSPEHIYGHNEFDANAYAIQEPYCIPGSAGLTKRQIKEMLIAKYPGCLLVKDKPFHEGKRWFGKKNGSRE